MTEEKSLKQKLIERLEAWKGELDELKVQLNLGRKEAETRYGEQKKAFLDWVGENRGRLNELESEFGEEMEELRHRWKGLRQKLEEEQAETWEAFAEQRENLNKNLEHLRERLEKMAADGSVKARHMLDELDNDIVKFRTRLDILYLQMHLGRMEAEDQIKSARGKSGEILESLKQRIAELSDDAEGKWEIVRRELGQAFSNIREAWKEKGDA